MKNEKDILKRITVGVVVFITLCICFGVTTFALIYAMVSVEGNVLETGFVDINLNDEVPVIDAPDLYFEPGMTVEKDFFIENKSPRSVYYRLYFNALDGDPDFIKKLDVKIIDKETKDLLYAGTPLDLARYNNSVYKPLEAFEKRDLVITFYLSDDVGTDMENRWVKFNLCADAVQEANNPNREFTNETTDTAPEESEEPDSSAPESVTEEVSETTETEIQN